MSPSDTVRPIPAVMEGNVPGSLRYGKEADLDIKSNFEVSGAATFSLFANIGSKVFTKL
jgi:hypothetical protein